MMEFWRSLMSGNGYAPHGYCLLWESELIWTSVVSDALIAAAYFTIPVALVYFVRKRPDVSFGWVFWAFAAFITACGVSHLMHIWNLWNGDYGAEVVVKAVTAAASVITAIAVWPLIPRALAIPSTLALEHANRELALRVSERDEALVRLRREIAERQAAEEQLLRVQKLNALGQLAGGMAHDVNNVLQAVRGNLELISRRAGDEARVRRFAENGLNAIERGARLTGQLLAFSRTQKIELQAVRVDLLIDRMEDLVARTLGPGIQVRRHHGGGAVPVLAEPTQLELAILNLAINARDAMPDGGVLDISSSLWKSERDPELADGEYIRVDVTDTGCGMDPDTAARAIEPFFTTKAVGKGTGLGLSMAYGVARQSGGTLRIASIPRNGTTVSLFLRRAEGEVDLDSEPQPSPADAESLPKGRATILVVDDDGDVRRTTISMLEMLGYDVIEAADGPAALKLLASTTPDLALLDFAMPGMNGADLARHIKASHGNLPILFASGFADSDLLRQAVGPDKPVLRKPFGAAELAATLNDALAKRTAS